MFGSKLDQLKNKAHKLYVKYRKILDSYSCGAHLTNHISSEASETKRELIKVWKEIKKLDPSAPDLKL